MSPGNKRRVCVSIEPENTNHKIEYMGRCLGMISEKEYAGVVEKPELHSKIFSVETKPISDINKIDDHGNKRLVVAVSKRDGVSVQRKTLFISEPVYNIPEYDPQKCKMLFMSCSGNLMEVEETLT